LINNLSKVESRPIAVIENRPSNQLVHRHKKGKWITDKELEALALKKYPINGKGITFSDICKEYRCSKQKAQRRLKNGCKEKIDKEGKKSSILFTLDNERTKPQQYFPSCIRATIIKNKRNRPIDPTGANYNNKGHSSTYPLHNAIKNQIVQSFLLQLFLLPWQPLNMHNIHLWTIIDKSHYEELKVKPAFNKTKIVRERIGLREVIYKLNKKGSIEIDISCSTKPFQIETDDDVNNFFIFLGKVQYTLAYILSDPRERIVPSVDKWILKSCDFNKDVEIQDKEIGQLLDLNIQVKHVGKAFRLYVKNLEDRFVLRKERTMNVNQPITTFLNDSILSPFHLINSKVTELINIVDKKLAEISNNIGNHKNK
jgi:hypothetical protein